MSTRALGFLCALSFVVLPGCASCCVFDDDDPATASDTPARQPIAPQVTSVLVPDWPPVGATTVITATASDEDGNLTEITFDFKEVETVKVSGASAAALVKGAWLGEGYGSLFVTAWDGDGGWADREVTNFLVDLTPPEGTLAASLFARGDDQDIDVWIADAWVVAGAELTFGGVSKSVTLEEGYPSTLGTTWDTSIVHFASTDFPEMSGTAKLRVWDAAGNTSTTQLGLTLDGTAPEASIVSPAPGSTLSGLATIEVAGADTSGEVVTIDVLVGGTPIATLSGPSAEVSVDLSEMAKGPTTIEAVAHDAAGNASVVASIDVTIE